MSAFYRCDGCGAEQAEDQDFIKVVVDNCSPRWISSGSKRSEFCSLKCLVKWAKLERDAEKKARKAAPSPYVAPYYLGGER